jgi:hypothetical protein
MNRAQNIYEFRRINMHGTKSGNIIRGKAMDKKELMEALKKDVENSIRHLSKQTERSDSTTGHDKTDSPNLTRSTTERE